VRWFRRGEQASTLDLLVAGLGNPGREYADTRHNVGFMVADELASRHGASFRSKFSGEVADLRLDGRVALLKPQTFMNDSGRSVGAAVRFFKVPPEALLVVHDRRLPAPACGGRPTGAGRPATCRRLRPFPVRARPGRGESRCARGGRRRACRDGGPRGGAAALQRAPCLGRAPSAHFVTDARVRPRYAGSGGRPAAAPGPDGTLEKERAALRAALGRGSNALAAQRRRARLPFGRRQSLL
jgi:hypothetical protein